MIHHSFDVTKNGLTWNFSAGDTIEEIIEDPDHHYLLMCLSEPAELTEVLLCCSYKSFATRKWRKLDFTGLTVFEVLQRLVKFYSNKTFRRSLGDYHFFEGFVQADNDITVNVMGS